MSGAAIAAAARGLVGASFRLHGRDPATGLDCVGVVLAALDGAGCGVADVNGYRLRTADADHAAGVIAGAGLARVDAPQVGDVALMRAGGVQLHLGIVTESGLVHADAHLRRVVERPGTPPSPVIAWFRAGGEGG
ncbi:peptidoglycan endopeptidase [Sphingomonas baiyangensis]|uniref:Peptidoglycan endopeptidase n=1 Tax=Sphingomonas baiyangensis TaxID=2572576 RepID=A0A4U1L405_9SPHN|nr:peptidoglycan endopeptidase [Sphingomonas baiyangensis]TKD51651.1 peptidoglycan endopeptidase [Sphingomonas baiyangensis]